MRSKFILLSVCYFLLQAPALSAQGFEPPAEGKAVVYFVRVTSLGFAISFEYFHQDKYIGIFKGKNYMRYECDPGQQLFWASSENKEFITADLKAGGTYLVLVNLIMGAVKARVGLEPVDKNNADFQRVVDLIKDKPPVITPQDVIDEKTAKLKERNFIANVLNKYETEWKGVKNFKHIFPDMAIPEEFLK